MRASILSLALGAAPALVSASGTLGFALGNKNPDASCKDQSDYAADLKAIAAGSSAKVVRTYAANECDTAKGILPAAKAAGFQVILGIWCVFISVPRRVIRSSTLTNCCHKGRERRRQRIF